LSIYWAQPRLIALGPHLDRHGITEDRVRPFLEARTEVLQRALQHIRERWGDFDGYATGCLGLSAGFSNGLRAALTI
jgi:hypothetical protein